MKKYILPVRQVDRDVYDLLESGKKKIETRAAGPKYEDIQLSKKASNINVKNNRKFSLRYFKASARPTAFCFYVVCILGRLC